MLSGPLFAGVLAGIELGVAEGLAVKLARIRGVSLGVAVSVPAGLWVREGLADWETDIV